MRIGDLEKKILIKKTRLEEIEQELLKPEVQKNPQLLALLSREYKEIKTTLENFQELKKIEKELGEIEGLTEKDLEEVVESEKERLKKEWERLYQKILSLFLPGSIDFKKNCLVEIRAAAGGEEAALFAADLFRMYTKFLEKKGKSWTVLSSTPSDRGGFKEIIFAAEGEGTYDLLRFEQGVHRVQRVPITEASGRIHTSTVTVAVLVEPEEVEVHIRPEDLKIDVFRASGHGGQHLQMTDSAVRITHLPTGIVVTCQDERSQYQNREKALKILKARILERERKKKEEETKAERRKQIGSGERAEKIRTYNFPQNRVTDHRINLSLYNLGEILDGELDPLIEELKKKEMEEYLWTSEK